jgi:endonuclease-3
MQLSLALDPQAAPPVAAVHKRLINAFGEFGGTPRLDPVDQLVKSLISSRTYDQLSWPAFYGLKARYRPWESLIEADVGEIQAAIAQVVHAESKAAWLRETLGLIVQKRGELSLDFLAGMPVEEAMAWLRQLPGVGDKVAASVLNFSTLKRKAMVVDTHVWRVARRIGLAARTAEPEAVRHAVMEAAPEAWTDTTFFDLHWLLKRLGQTLCEHNHTRCGACPVASLCEERKRTQAMAARKGQGTVPLVFGRIENKK